MFPTKSKVLAVLSLLIVALGCGEDDSELVTPIVPPIALEDLLTAGETIEFSGYSLSLATYLWRDFMPISPPDGKPLIAVVQVAEKDREEVVPEVTAEYLWVINGKDIWATTFEDEYRPPSSDYVIERTARDGPKWGPHISVDVVVGLKIDSGELQLLKAPDQWIHRTD